jgi:hypothetical protein
VKTRRLVLLCVLASLVVFAVFLGDGPIKPV